MGVWVLSLLSASAAAHAQSPAAGTTPDPADAAASWSVRASVAGYFFPDDENYPQPTVAADHGALHLESRYNYEDRQSISGFVGWNFSVGKTVQLELTPMIGGVVGQTDGIIPAVELDLTWRRLEFYLEGEYVVDVGSRTNNFLYNWSEGSFWPTEWLRAGVVTQRTRAYQTPRDIQRGLLVGVTVSKIEGTVYYFNPGSEDTFVVASVSVKF